MVYSVLVKKESANEHALKTKFIFNSSLLFLRENFQTKSLCRNNIVAKLYDYGL